MYIVKCCAKVSILHTSCYKEYLFISLSPPNPFKIRCLLGFEADALTLSGWSQFLVRQQRVQAVDGGELLGHRIGCAVMIGRRTGEIGIQHRERLVVERLTVELNPLAGFQNVVAVAGRASPPRTSARVTVWASVRGSV